MSATTATTLLAFVAGLALGCVIDRLWHGAWLWQRVGARTGGALGPSEGEA